MKEWMKGDVNSDSRALGLLSDSSKIATALPLKQGLQQATV